VLFSVNFLIQGGFTFFTTFFSVYLISRFHFSQGGIGDFFAYVGLWIAFTQAVVTRKVSIRFGEAAVLRSSILGIAIAIAAYFVPTASWQLLFITPFFAIANGLTQANITALISRSANKEVQGEILGINASVQALAQSIPPILSGYIAADLNPQAPLVISAVVIAIAALIFMVFYKKPVSSMIS
jgi:predicted MFS family arabinose efflux permease